VTKLKIGRFFYSNLFPIYYMLEKEADCSSYEFVEGVPSFLNREIREGRIDVSPSSSIEYLRNTDKYDLIEGHSISSIGPVGSVFLFSKRPIGELGNATVLTSSQSETSVGLLNIILNTFLGLECNFRSTSDPLEKAMESAEAYLVIGDDALRESLSWPALHIYDIGDLWYRHTGLPAVFALWIVRKESAAQEKELVGRFTRDLDRAKESALKNLDVVVAASPITNLLPERELISYWKGISYDFGEEHRKGLDLFRQHAAELGLLSKSG
jgi:chorismate dehydratase